MYHYQGSIYSSLSQVPQEYLNPFLRQVALTEHIAFHQRKLFFWESHYLRLMASLRILRMEIPMHFTMEFFEEKALELIDLHATKCSSGQVLIRVVRQESPRVNLPVPPSLFSIEVIESDLFSFLQDQLPLELYKDHFQARGLFNTLSSVNTQWRDMAWVYAYENQYSDVLILNDQKQLVETLRGSLFLLNGKKIVTPAVKDGVRKGVYRKHFIDFIKGYADYEIEERSISPFELQKAEELFVLSESKGMFSISSYRKKSFSFKETQQLHKEFSSKFV